MKEIMDVVNTFTVGQTFDKLVDFLPVLGVSKVPVQKGGIDILNHQLTLWWPRQDGSQGWINDQVVDDHMNCREIHESHQDSEKNLSHLNDIINSGGHLRMVFYREQYFNKGLMRYAGKTWLRYYGLYRLDVETSKKLQKLVWKQIDLSQPGNLEKGASFFGAA